MSDLPSFVLKHTSDAPWQFLSIGSIGHISERNMT